MNLKIKRTDYTTESTIGDLYLNDKFFGYTLEDVVRPAGAPKVYGKTAIPAGTYTVIISKSARFGCLMPEVLNVPGFAGIRLHAGSFPTDTDGCLLVGGHKEKDFINQSKVTYNKLFNLLYDAHERGVKMTLTIEDTKPSPLAKPAAPAQAKKTK